MFFSTSPSARISAEEKGFEVRPLQSFLSNHELEEMRRQALKDLDDVWKEVCGSEARREDPFGEAAVEKMVWYLASYELYNFRKTAAALKKVIASCNPIRAIVSRCDDPLLMGVRSDPLTFGLREEFQTLKVLDTGRRSIGWCSRMTTKMKRVARNGLLVWRSIRSIVTRSGGRVMAVSSGRLFGGSLGSWQLVELPVDILGVAGDVLAVSDRRQKGFVEGDWCRRLMFAELVEVWRSVQRLGKRHLWWIDRLLSGCDIVAYGYPPIQPGLASICIERARSLKVPVVGYQHGPNYGMQWAGPRLFYSDYSRCDVFWSWGLSRESLNAVLPPGLECPPVLPLGRLGRKVVGSSPPAVGQPEWDIVFPVTLVSDWFRDSLRIDSETMLRKQIAICDVLERLAVARKLRVLVKPINGLPEINDPISRYENRWPNLIWDRSILFSEVAVADKCRVMLTEFPSSPLFEALAGSVPVVAMNTPFIAYTEEIVREMGEGVRWADDIAGVERQLLALLDDAELAKQAAADGRRFAESVLRPADPAAVDQEFAHLRGVEKLP